MCGDEVQKDLVTVRVSVFEGAVAVEGGNANFKVRQGEGFSEVWTSSNFGRFS